MQLQVERMVATKQNSTQTPEDFLEGEELCGWSMVCVSGVWGGDKTADPHPYSDTP